MCDVMSTDQARMPMSLRYCISFFLEDENKDSYSWLEWIWKRAQEVDSSNYCSGSTKELELELSPRSPLN